MIFATIGATIGSIVEILIFWVVIYHIVRFFKSTRGSSVVIGILFILIILAGIAQIPHLDVLKWLLNGVFVFLPFAAIILFQPEIRKMFAELGKKSIFSVAHEKRSNIEVIIQGLRKMAAKHFGALIAIENIDNLDKVIEGGVKIDCEATPEMFETIFFLNNAIHDGGVYVRGDRIIKAACIFPLSQRQDISKSTGMRHRAALGLSEETDAVIIVLSEETGNISYAYDGTLTRNVSEENLRAMLTQIFVPKLAKDNKNKKGGKFHLFNLK